MKKLSTKILFAWVWRWDRISVVHSYDTQKWVRNFFGPVCILTQYMDVERSKKYYE